MRSIEDSDENENDDEEEDITEDTQSLTNLQHLPRVKPALRRYRRKRYISYHDEVELVSTNTKQHINDI